MSNTSDTLKELYRRFVSHMNPPVWLGSASIIILFVLFGSGWSDLASSVFQQTQSFIVSHFGWFYILTATLLLGVVIWLWFSRFGYIRLGPPDEEPDFNTLTWFSMLFAAGMGIGLVFYGVAEPLLHFQNAPIVDHGNTSLAVKQSMRLSFYHWGLHPWAIYVLFALALAYLHFRHDLPLAPRAMLYPVIGNRIYGWIGHLIDIAATVGTLFGVATSLGFGAKQINAGLSQLMDIPLEVNVQVALIIIITLIATTSVVLGLDKGISRLSLFNISLGALLFVFVFIAGPTLYNLRLFVSSLGDYLQHLPELSFWMQTEPGDNWQKNWTLFYWSWWISWSPFVGVFTARISKGRTVREFVTGVLVIPTLAAFLWLSVFGGTGLYQHLYGASSIMQTVNDNISLSLHALLGDLPLTSITSVMGTLLITIFFITSSDSGSFVDDMVTSGGDPNPPTAQRVFWAFAEGAVAITLLVAGGLQALRTASLISGLPMAIILLFAAYGIVKALNVDHHHPDVPQVNKLYEDKKPLTKVEGRKESHDRLKEEMKD